MVVFCSLFFSCKKAETKVGNSPSNQDQEVSTKECYEYVKNKDTIQLKLNINSKTVSGQMTYKLYQKDKNEGIIEGTMSGDTLFADYKFLSEGSESFRQVAFIKKNGKIIEVYGVVEEKNGKIVFKDKNKLILNSKFALNSVSCK